MGDPRLPGELLEHASKEFRKLGAIVEGPWFHRYHDGEIIMPDGKLFSGPGLIYYAALEVKNVSTATGDPTEESSEVGIG
jgi:hypothetical protein